jgi:UDP-glucose 4-epimerase
MQMTWLITGGAGYIGSHLYHQATINSPELVVFDDLSTGISSRLGRNPTLIQSSLLRVDEVDDAFKATKVCGVVHLAAKKRVGESVERPEYYWQENVVGFENLLSVMKDYGVKKLVYSSSAAVYGHLDLPFDSLISEVTKCDPINPYGDTKLEGERLAQRFAEETGASVVALRYFNVAGSGQPDLGDQFTFNLVPIIFDALDKGIAPRVFGDDYSTPDGTCVRDYVHVQDLAEAHISAMNYIENSGPGFAAINIGTGQGSSVREVIKMVAEVTGIEISPEIIARRKGDPASLVADVSLAKELLGWESRRDLRDIVTSAWEAWQYDKSRT